MPIKVLIVDDSAIMRQAIRDILETDPNIEVVATVGDCRAAWKRIQMHAPDVVTLDVEMPGMDGITFLEKLMKHRPLPVLMISNWTEHNCQITLRALELGAIDFLTKPMLNLDMGGFESAREIIEKVHICARANRPKSPCQPASTQPTHGVSTAARDRLLARKTNRVICIGASTGGTEALHELLSDFPEDAPGTVVVQHMPPMFTRAFADRLNRNCHVHVREAENGLPIRPGCVLIAPGGLHTIVDQFQNSFIVRVGPGEPVNRHRPSVDVLFHSAAKIFGKNATGIILTGMGNDGAGGMQAMHRQGAETIAQNEETCTVFGMPREAIATGGVNHVLPLDRIASALFGSR